MKEHKPQAAHSTLSPVAPQSARHNAIVAKPYQLDGLWNGSYPDWHSAQQSAGGYDTQDIFDKVRDAARLVHSGAALWERDSVLFHHVQHNAPVLGCLLNIARQHQGHLHVLDFGGALGSFYYQHKNVLRTLAQCTWHIVEQQQFVQCGKKEFTSDVLTFHESMEDALACASINAILFSGVLQYLESPYALLKQAAQTQLPILLDRTTVLLNSEYITVQHVPEHIYKASYPFRWLNATRLETILTLAGYDLSSWWQSAVDPQGFVGMLAQRTQRVEVPGVAL